MAENNDDNQQVNEPDPTGDPWGEARFGATPAEDPWAVLEPVDDQDIEAFTQANRMIGDPDSFSNSLARGFYNAASGVAKTIEIAGEEFEFESWEDFGREVHESYESEAARYGIPSVTSLEQIDDFEDFTTFFRTALASNIPPLLASIAGAVAGGTVGGPPGAIAGAFGPSYLMNTGELAEEIERQGGTDKTNAAALTIGGGLAALDTIGLTKVLKPFAGPLVKEFGVDQIGKELVKLGVKKEIAKGALTGMVSEGITEGLQEGGMLYSAWALTGTEMDPDELKDRVFTAAAIGGVLGGGIGSFSGAGGAIINNSEFKQMAELQNKAKETFDKLQAQGKLPNEVFRPHDPRQMQYLMLDPQFDTYASAKNALTRKGAAPGPVRTLIDFLGGKSITLLDRSAAISDSMDKIRNTFFMRERGRPHHEVDMDLFTATALNTGRWTTELNDALTSMSKDELNSLPAYMRGQIDKGRVSDRFRQNAERIRDLVNNIRQEALDAGLKTGYIADYFPRFINTNLLQRDQEAQQAFVQLLQQYEFSADGAQRLLNRVQKGEGVVIADDLTAAERFRSYEELEAALAEGEVSGGQRPGRTDNVPRSPSLERHRQLARIPDEDLEPFLVNDPAEVLHEYIRQASKRIPYAKKFGPREEKLKRMILQGAKEMEDAGRPLTRQELNRVYDQADAFLGMYHPIQHPVMRKANDILTTYNYINLLPLSLLSTIQEPLIALEYAGKREFANAVGQVVKDGTVHRLKRLFRWGKDGNKYLTKSEFRQDLFDFGLALDEAAAARIAATFGGQPDVEPAFTDFDKGLQRVTNKFFVLNGLQPATKLFKATSYSAGLKMIESRLKRLASEQAPAGSSRWRQWVEELDGVNVPIREGIEWVRNGARHDDPFYQQHVKQGAFRFTNGIVMHPNPFNRPMWMNNPHFRLLAQLKGFQTVFGNTVIRRWFERATQQGLKNNVRSAGKIAGVAIIMTVVAMLMNHLREMLTYWDEDGNPRTKNEEPIETVFRAFERTGFMGNLTFAYDATQAHKFGADTLDPFLGPAVSKATALFDGLVEIVQEGDVGKLRNEVLKSIPGLSVSPALREAIREYLE